MGGGDYTKSMSWGVWRPSSWVARTLHRNGRVFLVEAMDGNEPLADSVNTLLVMGFYLINIGYIADSLIAGAPPENASATNGLIGLSAAWFAAYRAATALACSAKSFPANAAKANQGAKIGWCSLADSSSLDIHLRTTPGSSFRSRASASAFELSANCFASNAVNR